VIQFTRPAVRTGAHNVSAGTAEAVVKGTGAALGRSEGDARGGAGVPAGDIRVRDRSEEARGGS
jgi:hypothetical protein